MAGCNTLKTTAVLLTCLRPGGLTDLHSGHSKLVIFSHCALVSSMHFGWYLQGQQLIKMAQAEGRAMDVHDTASIDNALSTG